MCPGQTWREYIPMSLLVEIKYEYCLAVKQADLFVMLEITFSCQIALKQNLHYPFWKCTE